MVLLVALGGLLVIGTGLRPAPAPSSPTGEGQEAALGSRAASTPTTSPSYMTFWASEWPSFFASMRASEAAATARAADSDSPRPSPTPEPAPTCNLTIPVCALVMTPPPITVPGEDPAVVAAITDAAKRLGGLRSYRFSVEIDGGHYANPKQQEYSDAIVSGVLTRKPKLSVSYTQTVVDPAVFGQPERSLTTPVLIIDEALRAAAPATPMPLASTSPLYFGLPDMAATREVVPYAGVYERIGDEVRNGVAATHYRVTQTGRVALGLTMALAGDWSADLWIARDGGYLLSAEMRCQDPLGGPEWVRPFHFKLDIFDANDPTIAVKP